LGWRNLDPLFSVGRGVTDRAVGGHKAISIHAPHVGSDGGHGHGWHPVGEFQSTPPVWGATTDTKTDHREDHISIHAPRVGGDPPCQSPHLGSVISIHAPSGGSDMSRTWPSSTISNFNPRSLWGSDARSPGACRTYCNFNPRSLWGSDARSPGACRTYCNFNPRSPWGSDLPGCPGNTHGRWNFNPHSLWGERQLDTRGEFPALPISIPAPTGGDHGLLEGAANVLISIPPPCEERRTYLLEPMKTIVFQSKLPIWGATLDFSTVLCYSIIQRADASSLRAIIFGGGVEKSVRSSHVIFQFTPPCARAITGTWTSAPGDCNFNPRPCVGGDSGGWRSAAAPERFNPHPPCGGRRLEVPYINY